MIVWEISLQWNTKTVKYLYAQAFPELSSDHANNVISVDEAKVHIFFGAEALKPTKHGAVQAAHPQSIAPGRRRHLEPPGHCSRVFH